MSDFGEGCTALDEARAIVYGDRERTYGHPTKNLDTIARMWAAYLENRFGIDWLNLEHRDVAVMMTLLKAARFANDPTHRDNVVDAIGYWALVERCDGTDT